MQRVYLQQPNSNIFFLTDRGQMLSTSKSMPFSPCPVLSYLGYYAIRLTLGFSFTEELDNLKKDYQDM